MSRYLSKIVGLLVFFVLALTPSAIFVMAILEDRNDFANSPQRQEAAAFQQRVMNLKPGDLIQLEDGWYMVFGWRNHQVGYDNRNYWILITRDGNGRLYELPSWTGHWSTVKKIVRRGEEDHKKIAATFWQ